MISEKLELSKGYSDKSKGPITVIVVNKGYLYLFLNWYCSTLYNKIEKDVRKDTIVVATDQYTFDFITNIGFAVVRG